MLSRIIKFFLDNSVLTLVLLLGVIGLGIAVAPFSWNTPLPSDPVPVDAIPDIGENQQIVFTEWPGRSPQDIEDQVTYPLTSYLLGIPGVKSIRSSSIFGFSSIYIIFNEEVEFYWSRSRILEKLNSLPASLLPEDASPTLGPDATALGQVFWYTLEGRDPEGEVTGGWDLHEIRSAQDFYVKYALNAVEGVSEVASIGGFVQEYQIDVDPEAMKSYNITLPQVLRAVGNTNNDVGAKTIEINQAEYLVRGLGYVQSLEDLENAVVTVNNFVPVRVRDVGVVSLGPATRRGILDKGGAEVVGGVVVARFGANPLEVLESVHARIDEIADGLPSKVLTDGTRSQLTIVPFYDRSNLIHETLGTLEEALSLEVLITILVVVLMVFNLRTSILISGLLPISILGVFIAMRYFGIDANIVALSGIAIAIGTMADLGIILCENILKHLKDNSGPVKEAVLKGSTEVASAIVTAVSTTVISFLPVFTLEAAEGKLFGPLAYTKTFALISALLVTLIILPTIAAFLFNIKPQKRPRLWPSIHLSLGIIALVFGSVWGGFTLIALGLAGWTAILTKEKSLPVWAAFIIRQGGIIVIVVSVNVLLAQYWLPLGPAKSLATNFIFVAFLVGLILAVFILLEYYYDRILGYFLRNKAIFFTFPILFVLLGLFAWKGFNGLTPDSWKDSNAGMRLSTAFPGLGNEFMPPLDEGSYLLMPTSLPHSGIEFNRKALGNLDMLVQNIPEIDVAVGKLGRVESALDPAPISMFENIINYKPEFALDGNGRREKYLTDDDGKFLLKSGEALSNEEIVARGIPISELQPSGRGTYFRNWRSAIQTPEDIWNEIVRYTQLPGVTSAPKLQPIETRLIMLQTGMRSPMGIKVYGPDLQTIEEFGLKLENLLRNVPGVKASSVFADRIVGKPYMNLVINREAMARYGLNVRDVQQTIEAAIGGKNVTTTVEGRERYAVRVRYPRELRDDPESLAKILIPTPTGVQIQLSDVIDITYSRGPQMIKSEDTFLVGYVLFDKIAQSAELEVVEAAQLAIATAIEQGELVVPNGVSYRFAGNYENQVRSSARLQIVVPVVLVLIFLILYLQFGKVSTSLMVFAGIALAFSGGFLLLWLYGQPWFLNFSFFGTEMRDLFQIDTVNLSVAVWVGFIALFGIATDDGVLMGTYLTQTFSARETGNRQQIHEATIEAGKKRIKPALMTVATTLIALLPVLTSSGRGSDIMIPMAIPTFGGMALAILTVFLVPVLFAWWQELKLEKS